AADGGSHSQSRRQAGLQRVPGRRPRFVDDHLPQSRRVGLAVRAEEEVNATSIAPPYAPADPPPRSAGRRTRGETMRVFLTGAPGYIGGHVASHLLAAGHTVVGLARNAAAATRLQKRSITPLEGDLRHPAALADAARRADGVVHTAFSHDTGNFADA